MSDMDQSVPGRPETDSEVVQVGWARWAASVSPRPQAATLRVGHTGRMWLGRDQGTTQRNQPPETGPVPWQGWGGHQGHVSEGPSVCPAKGQRMGHGSHLSTLAPREAGRWATAGDGTAPGPVTQKLSLSDHQTVRQHGQSLLCSVQAAAPSDSWSQQPGGRRCTQLRTQAAVGGVLTLERPVQSHHWTTKSQRRGDRRL